MKIGVKTKASPVGGPFFIVYRARAEKRLSESASIS